MALTLVTGPRRSGKSAVAERIASASSARVVYVAPLTISDDELAQRVSRHRARRPSAWQTVETVAVLDAVREAPSDALVLVDSLGSWIAEVMWRAGALDGAAAEPFGDRDAVSRFRDDVRRIGRLAAGREQQVLIVAEEAGWGPVPTEASTRQWLDLLGDCTQELARVAQRVLLVVAGRVLELP